MADRFKFQSTFKDQSGSVVGDGTVTVYLAGTNTLANIFTASSGGTAVSSVISDTDTGSFNFWVQLGDTNGYKGDQDFKIVLSKTNYQSQSYDNVKVYHRQVLSYHIFEDQDATPDVSGGNSFKTANTVATTITDFMNGYEGQRIIVVFRDSDTTMDFTGTNLKGNGGMNWSPNTNDVMLCTYDKIENLWYCMVQET